MSPQRNNVVIGIDDVRTAATRLYGYVTDTPLLASPALDALCGAPVLCKAENLQRTGSFKVRGALNHVLSLTRAERAGGIIAASSGNHAQAIAWAARLASTYAVVVVPADAPHVKVQAARELGAEVYHYARGGEDRDTIVAELARQRGLAIVPSANSERVIAGGGTVAAEILARSDEVSTLVVPVGGGGLAAGCAVAAKALAPNLRVVGVEPEHGADTALSLREGRRVSIPTPVTIADGLTHSSPAPIPFAINQALLDQVVTVSDTEIVEAMAAAFTHLKAVVEPSGACALAAAICGRIEITSGTMGVVLSGGNIAWTTFRSLIDRAAAAGGDGGVPGLHARVGQQPAGRP
ncbi:threonine ammonia-lyase [Nonomuraea candida]|uniref:threonine ammonia-lyase n=1 Tax=Nonomuraea candida TaxID=359159 RepID=UPI000A595B78|nr:threonine/serine dehydratase [Nonomuraea candida]